MNVELERRTVAVATVVIGLLAAGSVVAAVSLVPQSGTVPVKTESNLTVRVSESVGIPSGAPWDATGVDLERVRIASGEGGDVTVDQSGSVWTNTSGVTVGQRDLRINRDDARPLNVSGPVDNINVREINFSQADATTEIVASAGGTWTLNVENTGLSSGRGVVVVDKDTGNLLDATAVDADGTARFTELSSVTNAELAVKKGVSELRVFQETKPSKFVDDATLRIRFIRDGSRKVIQREIKNGKVDLSGIPRDERLTATVREQTNGSYAYRRVTLDNVQDQQQVFLLNTTRKDVKPVGVVFKIEDRTGEFQPASTTFKVQKPITKDFDGDKSNETRFLTIAGDVIGASGEFPVTLASENRYRLVVINEDGDRRVLGSYTARSAERSTIRIGRVTFDVQSGRGFAVDLQTISRDADNDGTDELFARIVYRDPAERTEQFSFQVSNETTTVLQDAVNGPLGNYTATVKLAENASARKTDTWKLEFDAVREQDDGTDETISETRYAGDVRQIAGLFPVDPRWLSLIGYVMLVAVTGLVVVVDAAIASVVAVILAGILTFLGIIGVPLPALGLGGAVAVMALVGRR